MAETLKTFEENDDILASETNSNNQYLLSKVSDMSAAVQNYVEGEIATIKTSLATIQATLQNNIYEGLLDMKQNVFSAISPNYNNGQKIGSTFTAPSYGLLVIRFLSYDNYTKVYINGAQVAQGSAAGLEGESGGTTSLVLNQGDKVTFGGNGNVASRVFYPCKGF